MDIDDVPQDDNPIYGGRKRLLYARTKDGRYTEVRSTGWYVEETATRDAVEEFQRLAAEALLAVRRGESSPLVYHMYRCRMDLPLLAQTTGIWRWRIRRHFKPRVFNRLPPSLLARYASVLGIDPDALRTCPETVHDL